MVRTIKQRVVALVQTLSGKARDRREKTVYDGMRVYHVEVNWGLCKRSGIRFPNILC